MAVNIGSITSTTRQFDTFGALVNVIIRNAYVAAGIITLLLLVFGGFTYIIGAGAGDTKKLEQGRKAISGAVIGLIIVVTSFWIVQIIELVTGVKLLG
jgi:hypothetical protein